MRNLYQEVTDKILAELQKGAAPWVKPWSQTAGRNVPMNATTNRPYSGINVVLFWLAQNEGWPTPRFLTFKQAKEAGGHVKAGEHGTKVYFVKKLNVRDRNAPEDASDEDALKRISMLREYTVFNVAQCDDLSDKIVNGPQGEPKPRNGDERDATVDEFIAATGAEVTEGHDKAFYAPGPDRICMPDFKSFDSAATFYGALLHELTHWTGHKSRLDRTFGERFGDHKYAAEELVAELGAAFLCAEFSIDGSMVNPAGYIQNWIAMLKHDSRAFFTAASAAQKAADFLRGKILEDEAAQAA